MLLGLTMAATLAAAPAVAAPAVTTPAVTTRTVGWHDALRRVAGAPAAHARLQQAERVGAITGRVVYPSGAPARDVTVQALRRGAPGSAARPATLLDSTSAPDGLSPVGPPVAVDARGGFQIRSLAPGQYVLRAVPKPSAGFLLAGNADAPGGDIVTSYFPGTADAGAAAPVTVEAGKVAGPLVVRLLARPTFAVTGVVADAAGQAVVDAMVRLVPAPAVARGLAIVASPHLQARTDARGSFSVGKVAAGVYQLIAVPPVAVPVQGASAPAGGNDVTRTSSVDGGLVVTETRDGRVIEYRDSTGTQTTVAVEGHDVAGLRLVIPSPAQSGPVRPSPAQSGPVSGASPPRGRL